MFKQEKGVTLVALVITIIVLLILAGVSIAMLTGDNGLLTKAKTSQTKSNVAEAADRANMEMQAIYADLLSGDSAKYLNEEYTAGTGKEVNGTTVKVVTEGETTKKVKTVTVEGKSTDASVTRTATISAGENGSYTVTLASYTE